MLKNKNNHNRNKNRFLKIKYKLQQDCFSRIKTVFEKQNCFSLNINNNNDNIINNNI